MAEWRIDSDNGVWPGQRQAIIITNNGILLIGHRNSQFVLNKMHLRMSFGKCGLISLQRGISCRDKHATMMVMWKSRHTMSDITASLIISVQNNAASGSIIIRR